jgi:hypothetical protein
MPRCLLHKLCMKSTVATSELYAQKSFDVPAVPGECKAYKALYNSVGGGVYIESH